MFIATVLKTAPNWKQPKRPSPSEWINKHGIYPYNRISLSNTKKQATSSYYSVDGLKNMLLIAINQTQLYIKILGNTNLKQRADPWFLGAGMKPGTTNGHREFCE